MRMRSFVVRLELQYVWCLAALGSPFTASAYDAQVRCVRWKERRLECVVCDYLLRSYVVFYFRNKMARGE